jgi:hypothetical protein
MNFGQRAGAGCGRKWGERKGSPKFISAWVVSRSVVTEINFGQRAGAGCGRKWGERKGSPKFISAWVVSRSGVTEINFGQRAGAGRKWGDRNKFRSTGRRGAGRKWGERKGSPKFISAWGMAGNGASEMNFGQRAGAGGAEMG